MKDGLAGGWPAAAAEMTQLPTKAGYPLANAYFPATQSVSTRMIALGRDSRSYRRKMGLYEALIEHGGILQIVSI